MSRFSLIALLCAAPCLFAHRSASAALTLPAGFRDSLVYSGFGLPVAMAFVPGPAANGTRILVLEQKRRRMQLLVNGTLAPAPPIGQITDVDFALGERGVLSLAIDPRWPEKPFVYTHYTSTLRAIHIVRYRLTGDLTFAGTGIVSLDAASKLKLIDDVPDANANHNGGCLRFGPDGMLYVSLGDDQQGCLAQDTTSLAGKLLRLDVRGLPETGAGPVPRALLTPVDNPHAASPDSNWRLVYALGLRNPFRMHIDPVDGGVFIADVGQSVYEEVNRIAGPANLGWPWFENTTPYTTCPGPAPTGLTLPIATLVNPPSRSIISMGPYRAPAGAPEPFPAGYDGDYFFSDYYSGVVRRIGWDGSNWVSEPAAGQPTLQDWATGALEIVDAAVGADGALWYLIQGVNFGFDNGAVHRIGWIAPDDTLAGVTDLPHPGIELAAPIPNPSRGDIGFTWTLARAGDVDLAVFDLHGRRVRTLERSHAQAGSRAGRWDGRNDAAERVAPGVYLLRLRAAGVLRSRRVVLTR